MEELQLGGPGKTPARAGRRRTLHGPVTSVGRMALLLGLSASLPRLVGRPPDRATGYSRSHLDGEVIAEEDVDSEEAGDPVRPVPTSYEEPSETSLILRPDVRSAALAAVGGVLAGAATVAAVRALSGAAADVKPRRRLGGRRIERRNVVASRSFLVDVHLLGR